MIIPVEKVSGEDETASDALLLQVGVDLERFCEDLAALNEQADAAHQASVFAEHRSRKAQKTKDAYVDDFKLLRNFLALKLRLDPVASAIFCDRLQDDPFTWRQMRAGMVAAFMKWLLHEHYTVGTANRALATLHQFANLAAQAQVISDDLHAAIRRVHGYSEQEAARLREQEQLGGGRREKSRKPRATVLTLAQARQLKFEHHPKLLGQRNRLLMCLLLDLGLRVSEALGIVCENIAGDLVVIRREKVDLTQTMRMPKHVMNALQGYRDAGGPREGPLLRQVRKGGHLGGSLAANGAYKIVRALGQRIGIDDLGPHDARHYWTTIAMENTPLAVIQKAGGWRSYKMPMHYHNAAEVVNDQVVMQY